MYDPDAGVQLWAWAQRRCARDPSSAPYAWEPGLVTTQYIANTAESGEVELTVFGWARAGPPAVGVVNAVQHCAVCIMLTAYLASLAHPGPPSELRNAVQSPAGLLN